MADGATGGAYHAWTTLETFYIVVGTYIICDIPTCTYKCSPVVTEPNYYSYKCIRTYKCSQ